MTIYGYSMAETLSKVQDMSVGGMVDARILISGKANVRLLKPAPLNGSYSAGS